MVLPDVTSPLDEDIPLRATVKVDIGGTEKTFVHELGSLCPELSSFYVFDSTSVHVHMKGRNTFSFSPAGLSVLTTLARITDEVRDRLAAKIEALESPSDFHTYFPGTSAIRTLVEDLSAETDLTHLAELARLAPQEEIRIHELEVQVGSIALGRHQQEIDQKRHDLQLLLELHAWIDSARTRLDANAVHRISQLIGRHQELTAQARVLGSDHFKHAGLSQVGTEAWDGFMKAAHRLARGESAGRPPYPQDGDVCLLCQQPLSHDARQLIAEIWAFLTAETQQEINATNDQLANLFATVEGEAPSALSQDLAPSRAVLARHNPELGKTADAFSTSLVQRGTAVLDAIRARQQPQIPDLPSDRFLDELGHLEDSLSDDIAHLQGLNLEERAQELDEERRALEHRKQLATLLPQIDAYVHQRQWAKQAAHAGGSTRHITQKYDLLFDQLVTNRYIEIFREVLSSFGRPLQVDIATSGKKGETLKQIQIRAHETAEHLADAEKVLSEGEKRAIALADFLTEATLDTSSSGIVLDDPVTSLDLEWRTRIAAILAQEAQRRQVIVFTHDLPFLYLLLTSAEELELSRSVHWI